MISVMDSHEVIKKAFERTGPKQIASEMGLSLSLVYKWAQPSAELGSGSRNPLDRVRELLRLTQEIEIVQWLCQQAGGSFVPNPNVDPDVEMPFTSTTNEIIQQFAGLLNVITQAALDDTITPDESDHIRNVWEDLKMYTEGFVKACEEHKFERIPVNRLR